MGMTVEEIESAVHFAIGKTPSRIQILPKGVNTIAKLSFEDQQPLLFKAPTFVNALDEKFMVEYFVQKYIYEETGLTPDGIKLVTNPTKFEHPFALFEYVPTDSPPNASADVARELGRILGQVHSTIEFQNTGEFTVDSVTNPSKAKLQHKEWNDFITERAEQIAEDVRPSIIKSNAKPILDIFRNAEIPITGKRTIGHMDYRPENLLWDISPSKTEAKFIVDWGEVRAIDSSYGQVMGEFFVTHMLQDEGTRERLREAFRDGYRESGEYFITPEILPQQYATYYLLCLLRKMRGFPHWYKDIDATEQEVQRRRIAEDLEKYTSLYYDSL